MKTLLLTLALLGGLPPELSSAPALPAPPAWKPPAPATRRLVNGMTVVALPRPGLPLVSLRLAVQAGSELDPPDRPGLAAATLLFLEQGGAGPRSAAEVARAVDALGAELRLEVDRGGASLALTVARPRLEAALSLLADLIQRPRLDSQEWPAIRARRLAELSRRRAEPALIADEAFAALLFPGHPYGRPALGTPAAVERLAAAELTAFYRERYGPRVTSLVAAGAIDLDALAQAAERHFGRWQGSAAPPARPRDLPAQSPRRVLIDQTGAAQSELRAGLRGPPRGSPDEAGLLLIDLAYGGSFTSRLNQNLREKNGYTYGAYVRRPLLRGEGPWAIRTAVRTDATAAATREILTEHQALPRGLTAAEVEKAQALAQSGLVELLTYGETTAASLAESLLAGQPAGAELLQAEAITRLTLEPVNTLAARAFAGELSFVIVGDRAAVEPGLRALFPTLEVRRLEELLTAP